jgi:hypothetical protein
MSALDWVYLAWLCVIVCVATCVTHVVVIQRRWRGLVRRYLADLDQAYAEGADDALADPVGRHRVTQELDDTLTGDVIPPLPPYLAAMAVAVREIWEGRSQPEDWKGAALPSAAPLAPVPELDGELTQEFSQVIDDLQHGFARRVRKSLVLPARGKAPGIGAGHEAGGSGEA